MLFSPIETFSVEFVKCVCCSNVDFGFGFINKRKANIDPYIIKKTNKFAKTYNPQALSERTWHQPPFGLSLFLTVFEKILFSTYWNTFFSDRFGNAVRPQLKCFTCWKWWIQNRFRFSVIKQIWRSVIGGVLADKLRKHAWPLYIVELKVSYSEISVKFYVNWKQDALLNGLM